MVNAMEWLYSQEEYNTKEERERSTVLKINDKNLEGHLDLREFTALETLNCSNNQLTSLDLPNCYMLKSVCCFNNQLISIDASGGDPDYPDLKWFDCHQNQLISLDLSACPGLEGLWCNYNQLTNLDLSQNEELEHLECDFDKFSEPERTKYLKWTWKSFRKYTTKWDDLERLINISDLNEWVENYDFSKVGDIEYHKICGGKGEFTCLDYRALNGLNNRIISRKSTVLFYLTVSQEDFGAGKPQIYEEKMNENVENYQTSASRMMIFPNPGKLTHGQQSKVWEALKGDLELLSRLQNLSYLSPRFDFNKEPFCKNPFLVKIKNLESELQMEREEAEKALQKAQEWRERQLKELKEQKDKEIDQLKAENARLQQQLANMQTNEYQPQILQLDRK